MADWPPPLREEEYVLEKWSFIVKRGGISTGMFGREDMMPSSCPPSASHRLDTRLGPAGYGRLLPPRDSCPSRDVLCSTAIQAWWYLGTGSDS